MVIAGAALTVKVAACETTNPPGLMTYARSTAPSSAAVVALIV